MIVNSSDGGAMKNRIDCVLSMFKAHTDKRDNSRSSKRTSKLQFFHHSPHIKITFGIAIIALLAGLYWLLLKTGSLAIFQNSETVQKYIVKFGIWGPLTIIMLMTGAIVFSPLPSAPIALASGAVYGHTWGTIYVLLGAEIGALIAFSVARLLGNEILHKWFGDCFSVKLLGNQNTLTVIVFVSRLIPFISFDIVSYSAGLTLLSFWRFALATLAGIIPASFLLAHFGGEMVSADARRITLYAIVLGSVTLLPIIIRIIKNRYPQIKGYNSRL